MNNAHAQQNMLNVKRKMYTGRTAGADNARDVVRKKDEKTAYDKRPKTVSECAGLREKYRVSSTVTTVPKRETASVAVPSEKKTGGYVYVEHGGLAATWDGVRHTKWVKTEQKSCFDKVVLVLLFAVLMFFVAGSYCEYNEAFKKAKEIRSEISECRDEQAKLIVAIEERNNRLNIDDYAVNTLGMVKSDKLTKYYINISEKDVVSISVDDRNDAASGGLLLSGFKNVVAGFSDKN